MGDATHDVSTARTVTVRGAERFDLPVDPDRVERFDVTTRGLGFECASGRWIATDWTGILLTDLLASAAMGPETTHVVFESADDYRTCIGVPDLLAGVLALDADDDARTGFPRLVSPAVPGPRASKDVVALYPLALEADDDPEDYEELDFEED
ncbi:MAG: molybdopterin-dependent oxidoreductase [Haloarculaceae archaeon]